MKRIVLLLLLFAAVLHAQEKPRNKALRIGIRGGAVSSNVLVEWDKLHELPREKWGFRGGLQADYMPVRWLGLSMYADYVQKGFMIPDRFPERPDLNESLEAFGEMIETGFDVRIALIENLSLDLGPYLAYWQRGKALVERVSDSLQPQILEYVVKGATEGTDIASLDENILLINPWDFGITGGLQYRLGKISLAVNYEVGLADLNRMARELTSAGLLKFGSDDNEFALPPVRFRTLGFSLIYWLR